MYLGKEDRDDPLVCALRQRRCLIGEVSMFESALASVKPSENWLRMMVANAPGEIDIVLGGEILRSQIEKSLTDKKAELASLEAQLDRARKAGDLND
jgi:hypothetical protein